MQFAGKTSFDAGGIPPAAKADIDLKRLTARLEAASFQNTAESVAPREIRFRG
jgi:hypothetical protein